MKTYGIKRYKLNRKAVALRNGLWKCGLRPVATKDYSKRGGCVVEYWMSRRGQMLCFSVAPSGKAEI